MKVLIIGLGSVGKTCCRFTQHQSIHSNCSPFSKSNVELEGVVNYYEFNEIKQNKYDFNYLNPTFEHKRIIEQVVQLVFLYSSKSHYFTTLI